MVNETFFQMPVNTVYVPTPDYGIAGILFVVIIFMILIYLQLLNASKKGRLWYHKGRGKWQEVEFEKSELLNPIPLIKTPVGYWDISKCTISEVEINIFGINVTQPLLVVDKNINTPLIILESDKNDESNTKNKDSISELE